MSIIINIGCKKFLKALSAYEVCQKAPRKELFQLHFCHVTCFLDDMKALDMNSLDGGTTKSFKSLGFLEDL
jgi:hypothetical protein